jgi:hypothetical protein
MGDFGSDGNYGGGYGGGTAGGFGGGYGTGDGFGGGGADNDPTGMGGGMWGGGFFGDDDSGNVYGKDPFGLSRDVRQVMGVDDKWGFSDISSPGARALSMLSSAKMNAEELMKDHPVAAIIGSLLGVAMPPGFGWIPGLLFAGAAEEIGKAKQAGFSKTLAAGNAGLEADSFAEANRGNGGGFNALAVAGAQAEQATVASQVAAAAPAAGPQAGLTPESAAVAAATAEKKAARQRTGLMAMRITNPWAMLTEAATVFRPGVFA